MWHTTLLSDSTESSKNLYEGCVLAQEKSGIVFTFPPDKSFVCLIDENGNQLLFESHVRYRRSLVSFEEAVKHPDCRGHMAFASKDNWHNM